MGARTSFGTHGIPLALWARFVSVAVLAKNPEWGAGPFWRETSRVEPLSGFVFPSLDGTGSNVLSFSRESH